MKLYLEAKSQKNLTCSFIPLLEEQNLTQKLNYYQGKTIPIGNKCKLGLNFKIYHSP